MVRNINTMQYRTARLNAKTSSDAIHLSLPFLSRSVSEVAVLVGNNERYGGSDLHAGLRSLREIEVADGSSSKLGLHKSLGLEMAKAVGGLQISEG